MTNGGSTMSPWYYCKRTAPSEQIGPFSWEAMLCLVQAGTLGRNDIVWNPTFSDWLPAEQVAGLFDAIPAVGAIPGADPLPGADAPPAAGAPPITYPPAVPAPVPAAPRRTSRRLPVVALAVALAIAGAGLGAYFGVARGGGDGTASTSSTLAAPTSAAAKPIELQWTKLNPSDGLPLARIGQALVYDPNTGKVILFGGADESTDVDDTWTFDPVAGTWAELHPAGVKPSARSYHAMVYDSSSGKVILFGGWTGYLDLDETWSYDPAAGAWTNLHPPGAAPVPRDSYAMDYDPISGKVILFGGWDDNGAALGDTWAYDPVANTWVELTPAGLAPPARGSSSMVYDPGTKKMILFGGCDENDDFNDTWAYDPAGNRWTELHPAGGAPTARDSHAMAYDPTTRKVVLFGGWDYNFSSQGDTWAYDPGANSWTELDPAGDGPDPRAMHSMLTDSTNEKIVLFGGSASGTLLNDVWTYDSGANAWTNLAPHSDGPCARGGHAMTYGSGPGKVILFGGAGGDGVRLQDTWAFDPAAGSWTELRPAGSLPVARDGHCLVYDSTSGKVILFGGYNGRFDLNDTWAYDPSADAWTDLNPTRSPAARDAHSMVYDPATGTVILFGGRDDNNAPLSDTWAYDPATNTWTDLEPAGDVPPARAFHSMVYDPTTGKVILFGGSVGEAAGPQNIRAGYPYAGAAWTGLDFGSVPAADDGHSLVYGSGGSEPVLRNDLGQSTSFSDTWVYDPVANTWAEVSPAGTQPTARDSHALAYDSGTGDVIMFGGWGDNEVLDDIWTYDPAAAAWTSRAPSGSLPYARTAAVMVPDPKSHRLIMFGGWDGYTALGDTWACAVRAVGD